MNIYLAGPINGCTDYECKGWRKSFKIDNRFNSYFRFFDPMVRDYRGKEVENVKDIVEGDKRDILTSDVVIANCPKPSFGTAMEVIFAWEHRKVIIVIAEKPSPWLTYHATLIVPTIEMAKEALLRVNPETLAYDANVRLGWGGK